MATKPTPKAVARIRVSAEERAYRARDDLRTMQQASQIAADPKRMKAAKTEADNQIKALTKVAKG